MDIQRTICPRRVRGVSGRGGCVAALITKSDYGTSEGGLLDKSRMPESVLGRPTTSMASVIAASRRRLAPAIAADV